MNIFKITYISLSVTMHGQVDKDVALRAASGFFFFYVTQERHQVALQGNSFSMQMAALHLAGAIQSVTDHRKFDGKLKAKSKTKIKSLTRIVS